MKKISIALAAMLAVAMIGCTQTNYKKTPGGMPYKIFSDGKGAKVDSGKIIKFHVIQKLNDSVLFSSYTADPQYMPIGPARGTYDISEVFKEMREGDSIIGIQLVDTFMTRNPGQMPPNFKKGDKLILNLKILKVFDNDSLANADYMALGKLKEEQAAKLLVSQPKEIEDYLKSKGITAVRTKDGAFVETIKEGTGPVVDSGKYVSVMYTGTLFDGTKFDSNVDPAFSHTEPLQFVAGNYGKPNGMIQGFDQGVLLMKKGGKAKIYMPSGMAYGANPRPGGKVKPFDNLIFDVELLDIKDAPPAPQMPPGVSGQGQ